MADYYRKTVDNTANDFKLKMQMAAFTLKLSENIKKISDLLEVDKSIKKDIIDNSDSIVNMKKDVANNSDNITKNYNISQINKKKSDFNIDLINNHITKFTTIDQNNENIIKDINDNSNRINNLSDELKNIELIDKSYSNYIIDFVHLFEIDKNENYTFIRNINKFILFDE